MREFLTVEPCLSIFKRGDDLHHCLEQTNHNFIEALTMYANNLKEDASTLLKIADYLADQTVEVDADTHMISIRCPKEVAEKMVEEELVTVDEYEDEEDEDVNDEYDEDDEPIGVCECDMIPCVCHDEN